MLLFVVVVVVALFSYINSEHAAGLIKGALTKAIGDRCEFSTHYISPTGKVELQNFELFSALGKKVVGMSRVEIGLGWGDLLTGELPPQKINVNNLALDLEAKNGVWDLAILNDKKKLPSGTSLFVRFSDTDLQLKRTKSLPGLQYDYNLICPLLVNSFTDTIRNITAHGNAGMERVEVDQFKALALGGDIMLTAGVSYDLDNKVMPITDFSGRAVLNDLNVKDVNELVQDGDLELDGSFSGDASLSFSSIMPPVFQSTFSCRDMIFFHPDLAPILRQLKYPRNVLVFKNGEADVEFMSGRLIVKKAGFYNDELVSVVTENATLDVVRLEPGRVSLPLKISAPYRVMRVKELRKPGNEDVVEVDLNVNGHFSQLPELLREAVVEKTAQLLLDKGKRRLEEKLNKKLDIKIDGKQLDVDSVIDLFKQFR